jgi:hypothetical protein
MRKRTSLKKETSSKKHHKKHQKTPQKRKNTLQKTTRSRFYAVENIHFRQAFKPQKASFESPPASRSIRGQGDASPCGAWGSAPHP